MKEFENLRHLLAERKHYKNIQIIVGTYHIIRFKKNKI